MDDRALEITKKLQERGHTTYIVGGSVRDLLRGLDPKDFDISTTARPRQIKRLIKNSYIIGRRFRLVLVRHKDQQYEVSTFRKNPKTVQTNEDVLESDNVFGSPKEDAFRRDFTCNALFFDPVKQIIIDHTGGLKDMQEGWLKLIGSPDDRLPEDPIRILRAIRFATKIGLTMKPNLLNGLTEFKDELKFTPLPRRREEWLKLVRLKSNSEAFIKLEDLGILETCLPTLMKILKTTDEKREFYKWLGTSPHYFRLSLEPTELFGIITLSLIKALKINFNEESLMDWIKKEDVQEFYKTELGTFKVEVTQIEQALRILPQLLSFEEFLKRGVRRQEGLISQKSFPLALTMHSLDPQNVNINDWINVYERWL